jgi:hypothetical protein
LEKYATSAGGQPDSEGAQILVDSMMASLQKISEESGEVTAYGIMANILTDTGNQISADKIAAGFMAGLQQAMGGQLNEEAQPSAASQKLGKILDMLNGADASSEDVAQEDAGLSQVLHEFFSIPKRDGQMKQFPSELRWEWPGVDKEEVMAEVNQRIAATPGTSNSSYVGGHWNDADPSDPNYRAPAGFWSAADTATWLKTVGIGKKVAPAELKTAEDLIRDNPHIPNIKIPTADDVIKGKVNGDGELIKNNY